MFSDVTSTLARDDTLFGVCQALGEDFGINPFILRVGFAVLLLWNPVAVIGAYAAAGAVVALSRLLSPDPRVAIAAPAEVAPAVERKVLAGDNETEALAVAA